jgi:hypothetical protein
MAPTGGAGLICLAWEEAGVHRVRRPAGACHPFNQRKEMALTIVETRAITGGVDTHADVHVAAALDPVGGLLGVAEFPVTPAGYARLLSWLSGFGTVCLVGIEGPAATAPAWPGTSRPPASGSSRPAAPTARTGAGKASPTLSTPSAPPGPRSPAGPAARRKAGTAPSRRSAR